MQKTSVVTIGRRTSLPMCLFVILGFGIVGCGPKVEMRKVDVMGGVVQTDQQKIREYLDTAGIKGQIVSIQDGQSVWLVDIGAPPVAPGKRQAPVAPTTVEVDKTTGKVSGYNAGGTETRKDLQ